MYNRPPYKVRLSFKSFKLSRRKRMGLYPINFVSKYNRQHNEYTVLMVCIESVVVSYLVSRNRLVVTSSKYLSKNTALEKTNLITLTVECFYIGSIYVCY